MKENNIHLRKDEDYITLNVLLKLVDAIQTGGMAKIFLQENTVLVNDTPEARRGRKLYEGDKVIVNNQLYVITK